MSDRHSWRGAEPTSRQETALLFREWSYMLDADTDGNPGFATRHVLNICVRVTVSMLQWLNSACTTVVYSVDSSLVKVFIKCVV